MRVGIVTEQLRRPTPGGIGRYVTSLVEALKHRSDIETTAVSGVLPVSLTSRLWEAGLPIRKRADILHATSFSFPRVVPSVPTTVFVHDLLWRHRGPASLSSRGVAFHERAFARVIEADFVVLVPSQVVADEVVEAGVGRDRVVVTSEGCDHLPLQPRTSGEPYFLSVGTFEPRKNLAALLAAYELLRNEQPDVPELRLVGSSDWRGMPGLPTELPVGVAVVGHVSDDKLARLYAGATAFVYPSLGEGFGLPPLEALRAGVPTVSSAVPSVTEEIKGPRTPVERPSSPDHVAHVAIIDPAQPESIARAMQSVLMDSVFAATLSASGKRWADERTWATVAERHVDVWRTLV